MNADAAREKLAAALWDLDNPAATAFGDVGELTRDRYRRRADALLPVFREIAAEELREAAGELAVARLGQYGFKAVRIVRDRADALHTPTGQRS